MLKNDKKVFLPLIDDIICKVSQFCNIGDLVSMSQVNRALNDMISIAKHNLADNKNCWKYTQCILSQFKTLDVLCHDKDVSNQLVRYCGNSSFWNDWTHYNQNFLLLACNNHNEKQLMLHGLP